MKNRDFDIIVIGGGHAGLEAAHIAASMGARVHLLTTLVENIALASCNPAIGGLGKGHLTKEIDALGGVMGIITDNCGIQYRTLNASKGPAVRGTRAQIDMDKYRIYARNLALNTPNLSVSQEMAQEILLESGEAESSEVDSARADSSAGFGGVDSGEAESSKAESKKMESKKADSGDLDSGTEPTSAESASATSHPRICGVRTNIGKTYTAHKIIITTGTFLRGLAHIGENKIPNGRFGESASVTLSENLAALGLRMGRLKTGTCPRVDGRSIDFSRLERHEGDENPPHFSYHTRDFHPTQLPCFVTYTNERTHTLIRDNFHRAPLFTGQIEGVGPRYCPSIEDKINRFADKERHQLFLEPQTQDASEYYINGLSTSLPFDVQERVIASIEGLENARITRYGYAIEYDYVDPTELLHTLECKKIAGLYLAGQINGTTGYEEAGALGLMAGINATLALQKIMPARFSYALESFVLRRDEGYIGVMIDDLVTKGTKEPYRVFTSRAEYRLLLREDNALLRLCEYARAFGTIDEDAYHQITRDKEDIKIALEFLESCALTPSKATNAFLRGINQAEINDKTNAMLIIGRDGFGAANGGLSGAAGDGAGDVAGGAGDNAAGDKVSDLSSDFAAFEKFARDELRLENVPAFGAMSARALEQIKIECKYHSYIQKQQDSIANMRSMLSVEIPEDFVYSGISGLSLEVIEKLSNMRPRTLFDASKISGITPASLDVLHLYIHLRTKAGGKGGANVDSGAKVDSGTNADSSAKIKAKNG